jgi:hypothetical protein
LELAESRRILPVWTDSPGNGRRWGSTAVGVTGGLIRFYHEIAGVGLVFPRADRSIAVEFPGYPVVRLRPIVLRRGVVGPCGTPSTCFPCKPFCKQSFPCAEMEGNPPRAMGWGIDGYGRLHQSRLRECSPRRCRWSVRNSLRAASPSLGASGGLRKTNYIQGVGRPNSVIA